ncbi:MAG: hypothetical protein ACT4O5_16805 [Gammaproteobacteria bacterium]
MHDRNPYAPSAATLALPGDASVGTHDGANVWREGDVLILVPDSDLPDRCVKCNAPAETPIKERTVYWHHPAIYLVVVLNVILYVIVALIARRKATVGAGLCGPHKKRRRVSILLGWIGTIAGFAMIVGGSGNSGYLMLFGSVILPPFPG